MLPVTLLKPKLFIFDEAAVRFQLSFQQHFARRGHFYILKYVLRRGSTVCGDCLNAAVEDGMWTVTRYRVALINRLLKSTDRGRGCL